jgi:hypothetical protein
VQHYSLNLEQIFEVRSHAAIAYKVHSVWSDAKAWKANASQTIQTCKPLDIALAPFEVLTLEAEPLR